MLSAQELERCRRAFLVFDSNSDGVIDMNELRASLITLGHPDPTDSELAVIIAELDKDQSGGVDFDEFLQVIEKHKAQQVGRGDEADLIEAFVAMGGNPDKSGEVAVERLQRTFHDFELTLDFAAFLEQLDKDADGTITFQEFKDLLTPSPLM